MKLLGRIRSLVVLVVASCTHGDTYVLPIAVVGPFGSGPDVALTFNVDQNYWPAWTEDGAGVLYAFVDPMSPRHRCVGLLPADGGTRLWQFCDNRASRVDSVTSYPAFALDSAGRLLLLDAVSPIGYNVVPASQLWLSDTARPFVRRSVLSLPMNVAVPGGGAFAVTWLADMQWTGPSRFLALAQQFETIPHCVKFIVHDPVLGDREATQCLTIDTLFTPGYVVQGTLAEQGATLVVVPGTAGATDYSLAENATTIVFAAGDAIDKVPIAGAASPTLVVPATRGMAVFGLGCRGTSCIVVRDSVRITVPGGLPITNFYFDPANDSTPLGPMELHRISIGSGVDELLQSNRDHTVFATPVVSQQTGDVIVQLGGIWGHLQTFATVGVGHRIVDVRHGALHLFKGLLP